MAMDLFLHSGFSVRNLECELIIRNVCALDFIDRNALDFLKELRKIDTDIYHKTIAGVNSGKVLKRWDQCGGINPRKTQWVKKRKREFFEMLGVTSELEVEIRK